ncbi:MAG: amino terminal protease self-immunity, partial [Pelosinus sp.]|nr:amino terminal protease self-immunity [Pelosinus sp.]
MNLKWICFGQYLEKGMDYYNQGMYADAKGFFQKAFCVNPSDFVLNFWLMRVAVMTHDYTGAKEYLAKCIEMKPALNELLIDPWSKVLDDSIQGKELGDLETLNQKTNKLLEHCQRNRDFTIYDFVGVVALYYLSWSVYEFILDVLQFRLRIQMTIHLVSYVYIIKFLIFLVPIGLYYFHKPLCTPNLWIELGKVKRCFSELCKNNSF